MNDDTTIKDILFFIAEVWLAISRFFYSLAYWSRDVPFVGSWLEIFFLLIAEAFYEANPGGDPPIMETCLFWRTLQLSLWFTALQDTIATFRDWPTIQQNIKDWLNGIEHLLGWWDEVVTNVTNIINSWWGVASEAIATLIAEAVLNLTALIDTVSGSLASLQKSWDEFKERIPAIDILIAWALRWQSEVLSLVNSWWAETIADVQALIDSAFKLREDAWTGWQELRDSVVEFFDDPWQWLYDRLEDFIERNW